MPADVNVTAMLSKIAKGKVTHFSGGLILPGPTASKNRD